MLELRTALNKLINNSDPSNALERLKATIQNLDDFLTNHLPKDEAEKVTGPLQQVRDQILANAADGNLLQDFLKLVDNVYKILTEGVVV